MQSETKQSTQTTRMNEKWKSLILQLEEYRLLILPAMVLFQTCLLVPSTILIISFFDKGLGEIAIGLLSINTFAILVSNMAGSSIKSILFIFAFSLSSNLVLLLIHLL